MQHDPDQLTNDFLKWFEKYVNDELVDRIPLDPNDVIDFQDDDWEKLNIWYKDELGAISTAEMKLDISWFSSTRLIITFVIESLSKDWRFTVDATMSATKEGKLRFVISDLSDEDIGYKKGFRNWVATLVPAT